MPIGATYCHQHQPTVISHAPDNHKETRLKIVYNSVSLKQYPSLVQAKHLGRIGMQKPSNGHILHQGGFENVR